MFIHFNLNLRGVWHIFLTLFTGILYAFLGFMILMPIVGEDALTANFMPSFVLTLGFLSFLISNNIIAKNPGSDPFLIFPAGWWTWILTATGLYLFGKQIYNFGLTRELLYVICFMLPVNLLFFIFFMWRRKPTAAVEP